jgi:hypothetical protein
MRKYLTLILAIIIISIIHESTHALIAMTFDEYQVFQVHPYGLEVIFKTPVAEREGIQWGFISGMSNVVTLLMGYLMFLFRVKIARLRSSFLSALGYWLIILFLLLDALNLSIGPFIYGGDIRGIVVGFGINQYLIQFVFFVILLLNRELIAQKLLPVYGIKTKHPLFRPWIRLKENI